MNYKSKPPPTIIPESMTATEPTAGSAEESWNPGDAPPEEAAEVLLEAEVAAAEVAPRLTPEAEAATT